MNEFADSNMIKTTLLTHRKANMSKFQISPQYGFRVLMVLLGLFGRWGELLCKCTKNQGNKWEKFSDAKLAMEGYGPSLGGLIWSCTWPSTFCNCGTQSHRDGLWNGWHCSVVVMWTLGFESRLIGLIQGHLPNFSATWYLPLWYETGTPPLKVFVGITRIICVPSS